VRVTDRDRERTARRLAGGYEAGLLGTSTFSHRIDCAYRARSRADLRALTADMPRSAAEAARAALGRLRPPPRPVFLTLPPEGEGPWTIGRHPGCRLVVEDDSVSRVHAELQRVDDGWEIVDLDSTNGTRLSGWRVTRARVRRGDELTLGALRVRLR
jgi:FHA domain/Domain of unknown function (DUF1707)